MDASAAVGWIGIVTTLGIAVVSWSRANRADSRATRALELAESAEARADRLERRETERRDVAWDQRFIADAGTLSFRNVGTDTAYDVELHVDSADETARFPRQSARLPSVGPTEPIGVNLTVVLREAKTGGWMTTVIDETRHVTVHARLAWRSAEGTPDSREWTALTL